mgnify:FL=1
MQVFSYKPREGAEEEIYAAIADITLSMRTTDYLDFARADGHHPGGGPGPGRATGVRPDGA